MSGAKLSSGNGQQVSVSPSSDLSDDLRCIAAHEADPRKEERLYEAADVFDEMAGLLTSLNRSGFGISREYRREISDVLAKAGDWQ